MGEEEEKGRRGRGEGRKREGKRGGEGRGEKGGRGGTEIWTLTQLKSPCSLYLNLTWYSCPTSTHIESPHSHQKGGRGTGSPVTVCTGPTTCIAGGHKL